MTKRKIILGNLFQKNLHSPCKTQLVEQEAAAATHV